MTILFWLVSMGFRHGHPSKVDAIYVATPPGSHLEVALEVAKHGKPCYLEKPMARTGGRTPHTDRYIWYICECIYIYTWLEMYLCIYIWMVNYGFAMVRMVHTHNDIIDVYIYIYTSVWLAGICKLHYYTCLINEVDNIGKPWNQGISRNIQEYPFF